MLQIVSRKKKDPQIKVSLNRCDLGGIQTPNLLSRNQMHYSVMLRGLLIC